MDQWEIIHDREVLFSALSAHFLLSHTLDAKCVTLYPVMLH